MVKGCLAEREGFEPTVRFAWSINTANSTKLVDLRYPGAHNILVAGSSAVRTNNEINSSSEPVCGRGGLSPQGSGKCLHRQGGLLGSSLTPKKLDNKETAGSFFPFCSPWYPIVRWVYSRRSTSASPGHDARDDQRGCAAGEQLPWSCSSTASPR
jgi:hypothetical protein